MSELKVKNHKIQRPSHFKKYGALALGIIVIIFVTIFFAVYPTFAVHDIYVKYGKDTYQTTSNATLEAVFSKINDGSVAPGNLVSLTGSVIETGTGAPIVLGVNGKVAPGSTLLKNGDVITATSGQNTVEKKVKKEVEGHIGFNHQGQGPVLTVESVGKNPVTTIIKGEKSGAVVSRTVTQKGVKPFVQYNTYANNKYKIVALTFDDGPSPRYTQKVLAVLKKYQVKATFFELGTQIKKYPDITKAVAASGNQVALHSEHHVRLAHASIKKINKEVSQGKETIKSVTGSYPTFMRPPYGSVDGSVFDALHANGLGIGLWSIDTRDWSRPGTKHIIRVAKKYAYPGAVILMHDGGGNRQQTVDALPAIIKAYKRAGYHFVTLDEYAQCLGKR